MIDVARGGAVREVTDILTPDRDARMAIAATEYTRFVALLCSLSPGDWSHSTECDGWDVRAMATHVLGFVDAHVSLREFGHQAWQSKRLGGNFVDGMTATQVRDRAVMTPEQIIEGFERSASESVRARRRMPAAVRALRMSVQMPRCREWWPLSYLNDVIYTRDTWMHRVDITRATGVPMVLTPEHDGVIVADAVKEWARRHGQPFRLVLGGPAGGAFVSGEGGDTIEVDAVEFCRTLSGRGHGERGQEEGLLAEEVPF
jgi:uncharacterized protein (TIGR03083 family)